MNTHVKEAGFLKRFFAYVVDALLVILPTILLYNFVTSNVLFKALGGNKSTDEMYSFALDSTLLKASYSSSDSTKILGVGVYSFADTKDASSIETGQTEAGYQEYYKRVWYYYTQFIYEDSTTKGRAVPLKNTTFNTTFTAEDYYTYFDSLMGLPSPSQVVLTGDSDKDDAILAGESPYFKYALNDAGTAVDIHKMPVLQKLFQGKVDAGTSSSLTTLKAYFYDTSSNSPTGLYATAVYDLTGQSTTSLQTYYSERLSQQNYDIWLCAAVVYAPLQLIFFLILPLCLKDGQTIGKLAFGLSVVKIDGFRVGFKEKIIHQLFVALLGLFILLPWSTIGILLYFLLAAVDYMVLVMSKTHQSLHDRLAKTMVISKKESLVFDNEEAMAEYAKTHPEQFPELKKSTPSAEELRIAQEDSILDLSTLNKARDEAHSMTNFDEYEQKKDSEISAKTPSNQPQVNLTKDESPDEEVVVDEQAMADLAKLEGGTPTDEGEVSEEEKETKDANATPTPENKPNEEGFTDETPKKGN